MMKNDLDRVLVFSDCYIYGGSERLMSFLMNNDFLNKKFNLTLAFRNSKDYNKGLKGDLINVSENKIIALCLLSNETLFHLINCLNCPGIVKKILKAPFFIIQKLGIYALWNLIVFSKLLKSQTPSIIHINNGGYPAAKSCNVFVLANYLFGRAKVIYQVNNQAQPASFFGRLMDKFIKKHISFFVTASYLAKEKLIRLRGFNPDSIKVINNCVIPIKPVLSRKQICGELKIAEDSFIITQVAFLTNRKGQAKLIGAIDILFQLHPELQKKIYVLFIGNGEDERALKNLVTQLQLQSNLLFLGFKQNSHEYIAISDVFALPSISDEDMPLVLLSALCLGKPIIASNFAGIKQVILNNVNGLLVDLNESEFEQSLADAIYRLYKNSQFREELAKKAKESFLAFTPEQYGLNLSRIYCDALKK